MSRAERFSRFFSRVVVVMNGAAIADLVQGKDPAWQILVHACIVAACWDEAFRASPPAGGPPA